MRVFFITSKINFNRAGGSVPDFDLKVRAFKERGNEVTALTVFPEMNDIREDLPYKHVSENIVKRTSLGITWGVFRLFRKYETQADFFYCDGHLFLFGAGLYRFCGGRVPVVAFFNRELTSWPEMSGVFINLTLWSGLRKKIRFHLERILGTYFANKIDLFFFTSPALKKAYEDFGLRNDEGALILADLIDYDKKMKELSIRGGGRTHKVNEKPVKLLYSGRMVSGKGFELLIEAISKLNDKNNYRLILSGDGPLRNVLEAMVKDKNLQNIISFTGWVEKSELYEFFRTVDIFILPRWRKELTSVLLLEAMMFGLPSIVPQGGGLAWVAGSSALTFSDGDSADLANKISMLSNDYNLMTKLSGETEKRLAELDYRKKIPQMERVMLEKLANMTGVA